MLSFCDVTDDALLAVLDAAWRELLGRSLGECTPDEALRLANRLQTGTLEDGITVLPSDQVMRVVRVVSNGIGKARDDRQQSVAATS